MWGGVLSSYAGKDWRLECPCVWEFLCVREGGSWMTG